MMSLSLEAILTQAEDAVVFDYILAGRSDSYGGVVHLMLVITN